MCTNTNSDAHCSVYEWHMANLEFANATTLDTLDITHWDQVIVCMCVRLWMC